MTPEQKDIIYVEEADENRRGLYFADEIPPAFDTEPYMPVAKHNTILDDLEKRLVELVNVDTFDDLDMLRAGEVKRIIHQAIQESRGDKDA